MTNNNISIIQGLQNLDKIKREKFKEFFEKSHTVDGKNIKEQILNLFINLYEKFCELGEPRFGPAYCNSDKSVHEEFNKNVKKIIDEPIYDVTSMHVRDLIADVLYPHQKAGVISPFLEKVFIHEVMRDFSYSGQRLHYNHTMYVFLIGLYLYHCVPDIKICVNKKISAKPLRIRLKKNFDRYNFSGGSPYGEFLYRWRLASLSHDIALVVNDIKDDPNRIKKFLQEVREILHVSDLYPLDSMKDIYTFNKIDFSKLFEVNTPDIPFNRYMEMQLNTFPYDGDIFYDHGIYGAFLFLRKMLIEFERHGYNVRSSTKWHKNLLGTSLLEIAIMIALHNLDQNQKILDRLIQPYIPLYDIEKRPMAWLLKVCDTIQEWDKPPAKSGMYKSVKRSKLKITCYDNKILISGLKMKDLEKLKSTLINKNFNHGKIKFLIKSFFK